MPKPPKSIVWCGEDCLILVYKNVLELVGENTNKILPLGNKKEKFKGNFVLNINLIYFNLLFFINI